MFFLSANPNISVLWIIPITFLSISLSRYYNLSIIVFQLSLIIFFNLSKKNFFSFFIFFISSILLDAYSNNMIGVTFLSLMISFDALKIFLIIINHQNYLVTYPVQSFAIFVFVFNIALILLNLILSKAVVLILPVFITCLVIISIYFYLTYKKNKIKLRSYHKLSTK